MKLLQNCLVSCMVIKGEKFVHEKHFWVHLECFQTAFASVAVLMVIGLTGVGDRSDRCTGLTGVGHRSDRSRRFELICFVFLVSLCVHVQGELVICCVLYALSHVLRVSFVCSFVLVHVFRGSL